MPQHYELGSKASESRKASTSKKSKPSSRRLESSVPAPQLLSALEELDREVAKEFLTICGILEQDPDTFAAAIVYRYIKEISTEGRLYEMEVSPMDFDTRAEEKRITRRAEAYDEPRHEAFMASIYSRKEAA